MNFNLSEEQTLIRDSIARFVADNYGFDKRNEYVASEHGFSNENWQQFAELGWLSLPFAEEHGGFGGNAVDTMIIMQEFGQGLVAEPYLPTVMLFGALVQAGAPANIAAEVIPAIIAGELQGAFAYVERQSRYELSDVTTSARQEGDSWVISGEKTVVLNGGAAQKIVVAARTSGAQSDESGISLFLVDGAAQGMSRATYRMTDGLEAANITLENVSAEAVIGTVGEGLGLMEKILDAAILGVAANALGAMEFLNATTLEYCKTRKQFGETIGSFQALQHRMVDTFSACENTRSLLYRAVCATEAADEDAPRSLHALKVMVGKAGKHVGGEAIQLHGGMGMTDELPVGFYVKRLMIINTLFGDADYHQQKFQTLVNAATQSTSSAKIAAA
jgi:alkylation response protein AidB-like acyl-CoA dehydrogenase